MTRARARVRRRTGAFRVVVAIDGSPSATAALTAALAFPWPRGSRAGGIVARGPMPGNRRGLTPPSYSPGKPDWPVILWRALDVGADIGAANGRRMLRRRWPDADVRIVDANPVDAILGESAGAGVTVLGAGNHGRLVQALLGSVSRAVVAQARGPCLVVRTPVRTMRRFVVGLDGSRHARRAIDFLSKLTPAAGHELTLVRVIERVRAPSLGLMPSRMRATVMGEMRTLDARATRAARRDLAAAATRLRRRRWSVRAAILSGAPVEELLRAVRRARGHVLVVGARGVGALATLLLGSVAQGAVNRSRVPVLVVR